jgi:hypothetical protein
VWEDALKQVVIENPILNSPYKAPTRHFKFTEEGITNEIIEERRPSSYFIPIAKPRNRGKQAQLSLDTEWTEDRLKENDEINRIRARVDAWRKGGYVGITKTSSRLLEYWNNPEREKKLFFCQIEALETAIYLAEVASKYGDAWIENKLREVNEDANPLLFRIAFKMATGSGKTVVMAMLIAWHALNKLANPQDARYSDTFLFLNGEEKNYYPDFIVRIRDDNDDFLNLIIEVTGEHKKDKVAKVSTAKTLWIPAINNHGGFGRWAFIEIIDPWNAKNEIRAYLQNVA